MPVQMPSESEGCSDAQDVSELPAKAIPEFGDQIIDHGLVDRLGEKVTKAVIHVTDRQVAAPGVNDKQIGEWPEFPPISELSCEPRQRKVFVACTGIQVSWDQFAIGIGDLVITQRFRSNAGPLHGETELLASAEEIIHFDSGLEIVSLVRREISAPAVQ